MSISYISSNLRKDVAERADEQCEYCRLPAIFYPYSYHIDHIISEKQGGETTSTNLAYCCPTCNFRKGSDISAYLKEEELIVDLFNPRKDEWETHFELDPSGRLRPLSQIGKGSIRLLKLNTKEKVKERKALIDIGFGF